MLSALVISNQLLYPKKSMKRFFDIIISFFAILVISPILLVAAICVFLDSGLPIIYRQDRLTKNKKLFKILKFRSMINNKESAGFTQKNDPRVTRIGKILRKTSVDELPQLINVLIGDMSLVGPRPKVPSQVTQYKETDWNEIHQVLPGITGLAQVNGRSELNMEQLTSYELQYVREHSIVNDFKIILKTFTKLKSDF